MEPPIDLTGRRTQSWRPEPEAVPQLDAHRRSLAPMPAESVTIPSGASTIGGYLALPEGAGPHPAVVVIHEAFGLTDNIREIARRFADHGYAALAVDLFSGRNRVLCMARLMTAMLRVAPDRFGIRDLSAALGYLSTVPTIDAARLGAMGFCGRRARHRLGLHR
jgi:dienelactone hydrolase